VRESHDAKQVRAAERAHARIAFAPLETRGAAGFASARRGRPSHRKIPSTLREQALGLIREQYSDLGPSEHVTDRSGARVRTASRHVSAAANPTPGHSRPKAAGTCSKQ